jgi:hypothetical protein
MQLLRSSVAGHGRDSPTLHAQMPPDQSTSAMHVQMHMNSIITREVA